MAYTMQEQIELDQQLKRWQKRQLTAVRQSNIDKAFELMNDIERAVWEQVARAESYKDISVLAWIGTVIFLLADFGYSTVVGNPLVSIICGAMIVGGTFLFIVVALYDYQRINSEKRNKE